ncbi:(d)CMP kinase [Thermostilla marina]
MIVTIDGPAGAGKSTVAKRTARRLGFDYLDTGAMYRAVALAGMRAGVDWNAPEQLEALLPNLDIRFDGDRILLNGEDVSEAVRTPEVTAVTRFAADNPNVRADLVRRQREIGASRNLVTEGRDQGTVVFPDAECKIYLWASPEERARRRYRELLARGMPTSLDDVLREIVERDRRDQSRSVGPLRKPANAVDLCTDGLSIDEVVDRIVLLVRAQTTSTDDETESPTKS